MLGVVPTDIADSFDLRDGVIGRVVPADDDGVNILVVEVVEDIVTEFDWLKDFAVNPERDDWVEGGDLGRRNCLGCFRKVKPGVRPRRCFSEGEGDSPISDPSTSDLVDLPDIDLGAAR